MARPPLVALCLAVLAVTAGCSGVLPGGDGSTRDPFGVPGTTAETTTHTTTTTTVRTVSTPTPVASLAFREALANHTVALREAGQFVFRETIRRYTGDVGANFSTPFNRSVAADLAADRYWLMVPSDPGDGVYDSGVAYQNGSAVYHRDQLPNGTMVYRPSQRRPTPREFSRFLIRRATRFTLTLPFERNGTATVGGRELARFTANDPGSLGCLFDGRDVEDLRNVTSFSATALVDDRGILRKYECELRGELYTGDRYVERVTRTITEVGTATVRPPARLVEGTNRTTTASGDDESTSRDDESTSVGR